MVLPLVCGSGCELEHLADDDGAGDVERVDVFFFEADRHEGGVHVARA